MNDFIDTASVVKIELIQEIRNEVICGIVSHLQRIRLHAFLLFFLHHFNFFI